MLTGKFFIHQTAVAADNDKGDVKIQSVKGFFYCLDKFADHGNQSCVEQQAGAAFHNVVFRKQLVTADDGNVQFFPDDFPRALLHAGARFLCKHLYYSCGITVFQFSPDPPAKLFPVRLSHDLAVGSGLAVDKNKGILLGKSVILTDPRHILRVDAEKDQLRPSSFIFYARIGSQCSGKSDDLSLLRLFFRK